MVTMTHTAKISGRKLNLLDCNQNWIKFIYKLIQKTDPKLIKNKNMDISLPTPPFMFATFALLLFLLLFTPVFVNTNRYVLVMARETLQTQIIHNLCDYIARSTTSRKGVDDENKHLTTYVLGIVIGGENIDWQLPSSVQTVCELLGVKKTTVYKYRKQIDIKYVQPKRQTRSDALDSQPWYYWIPFGN